MPKNKHTSTTQERLKLCLDCLEQDGFQPVDDPRARYGRVGIPIQLLSSLHQGRQDPNALTDFIE